MKYRPKYGKLVLYEVALYSFLKRRGVEELGEEGVALQLNSSKNAKKEMKFLFFSVSVWQNLNFFLSGRKACQPDKKEQLTFFPLHVVTNVIWHPFSLAAGSM